MHSLNGTAKGLVTGGFMLLLSIIFYFVLRWPVNGYSQFVLYIIYAVGIAWSVFYYVQHSGASNPKDICAEAFKTFIVVTLLMVVFTYLYYRLNPQLLEETILQNNEMIRAQQNHTEVEIEENANKLRSIFRPMMTSITLLRYLVMGAVFSIIFTMLFRKRA